MAERNVYLENLDALRGLSQKKRYLTIQILNENYKFIQENKKEILGILNEKDSQFTPNTLKELKTLQESEEFKELLPYWTLNDQELEKFINNLSKKDQEKHKELFAQFVEKKVIKAIAERIAEKLQCSPDKVLTILTNNPSIVRQIIQTGQITPETLGKIAQKVQEVEQGIFTMPIASPINKTLGILPKIQDKNQQKTRLGFIENTLMQSSNNTKSYSFLTSLLNTTGKTQFKDLGKFVSNDTAKNHIPQIIKQNTQVPQSKQERNTNIMTY